MCKTDNSRVWLQVLEAFSSSLSTAGVHIQHFNCCWRAHPAFPSAGVHIQSFDCCCAIPAFQLLLRKSSLSICCCAHTALSTAGVHIQPFVQSLELWGISAV